MILLATFFFVQLHQTYRPIDVKIPPQTLPADNSYDNLMSLLGAKLGRPAGPSSVGTDPRESWSIARLKAFSDTQRPTIDAIRAAMKDRPFMVPRADVFSMGIVPYARMRELARHIVDETYYRTRI